MTRISLFLFIALLVFSPLAHAEKQPANANLLDVTRAEFGAIPNDGLDDYPAIKLAMGIYDGFNGNTLYFPCGVYNFSDTVEWRDWTGTIITPNPPNPSFPPNYPWSIGMPWEGEREDCVEIRLMDNAPGFDDPNNPKSFLKTGSLVGPSSSDKGLTGDKGNGAYQNSISNMTINCGSGNPGVLCVDWLASNAGELYNLTIKSEDGQGFAGIYLSRQWPGPCFVYKTKVEGFQYGIHVLTQQQYSVTFLDVELEDQTVAGIYLTGNMITLERLTSNQSIADVPALFSNDSAGLPAILNSTLNGNSATRSAIEVGANARYFFENVTTSGYANALKAGTTVREAGAVISQAVFPTPYKVFNSPDKALQFPFEYPPEPYWSDPDTNPEEWANVMDYGVGNGAGGETVNDVAGIQAAFNSGKPIIYFPKRDVTAGGLPAGSDGIYAHGGPTITVPSTVRRVFFNRNSTHLLAGIYTTGSDCVYTVVGTADDPPVEFNNMRRSGVSIIPANHICNKSNGRKVVIRSSPSSLNYQADGPNTTFILDVIGGFKALNGAKGYFWQFNQENGAGATLNAPTAVVDNGSELRVIGYKTEADFPVARITNGSKYKAIGGFTFPCIGTSSVVSSGYIIQDSQASFSVLQTCTKNPATDAHVYGNLLAQTIGPATRYLTSRATVYQGGCCSRRVFAPLVNAFPNLDAHIDPQELGSGSQVVTLPYGKGGSSWLMMRVDPSGVSGVSVDPGMWTQPFSCSGLSHATFQVQKNSDGALDVDLYTCQQPPNAPIVGQFDPKETPTPLAPKNCRNLTSAVNMDGNAPNDVFEYEGPLGLMIARLNDCQGDCKADVSLTCAR